jgi:hypothetical protein
MNLLHVALQVILLMGASNTPEHRSGIYDVVQIVSSGHTLHSLDMQESVQLLTVMCYLESGFKADAVGFDGLNTIGALQLSTFWAPKSVLLNRKENIRVGIGVINYLSTKCSGLHRGLGAFMTGTCGGAPKKTSGRCLLAGLTSQCLPKI